MDGLARAGLLSYITVHTTEPGQVQSPKPQQGFTQKHEPIIYINSSRLMFSTYTFFFPCNSITPHFGIWQSVLYSVRPVSQKKQKLVFHYFIL